MLCLVTNTSCEQMPMRDIKNVIPETRGQSFQKFKVRILVTENRTLTRPRRQNDSHTMQTRSTVTDRFSVPPIHFHPS